MLSTWRIVWLVFVVGLAAAPCGAEGLGLHERFDAERAALTRQLRNQDARQRITALEALAAYPVADATRLTLGCFVDEEPSVRSAALDVLRRTNDQQEVCDALLAEARSGLRDAYRTRRSAAAAERTARTVLPAVAVLLDSPLPLTQVRTHYFLDQRLAKADLGPELMIALADELALHGAATDAMALARISHTRLFEQNFAVRRATVQALTQLPSDAAIDALVAVLQKVGGEAKADAARHLTKVTGQRLGLNARAWHEWRLATAANVNSPRPRTAAQWTVTVTRADELDAPNSEYYGLPIFAERLVFVLDISGSMRGGRMVAAKRELIRAIESLPSYTHFGIVVFNGYVHRWQRELVAADANQKRAAIGYVERQEPAGNTASSDALDAALGYDTEAIYFLTDGAPTAGKIRAPVDIVRAVGEVNRTRRVSMYTIGIAPGFAGSPTDEFLRVLAEQNFGQYRRVDH